MIHGAWLSPGIHVDLIGGFTPKMREADSEAVLRAVVYVDTPHALHEAGDLSQPIASTLISASHICGNLAELAGEEMKGRSSGSPFSKPSARALRILSQQNWCIARSDAANSCQVLMHPVVRPA
ncbi:hypothetical protein NKJ90_23690 [Mesorhizobium sp. M0051]|uniref:hypothetical protein n=1 Tax=Mesorhizobium sp. M0051 TaxID=2956862 RepID=UPI00333A3D27